MKLSGKDYWENHYKKTISDDKQTFPKFNSKTFIKKLLGNKIIKYSEAYDDYLLWNVIYEEYMPKTKGARILEIGSAPGDHLVKLHQIYGFIPYGVEYSQSGVELNRKKFTQNSVNANNVIFADFLSEEFQKEYQVSFDIVISRGFIEHFNDVDTVIKKHINLLRNGGLLIISIPNYIGIYYAWIRLFRKEILPMYNFSIMHKKKFTKLFAQENLMTLFCDYYGTFSFNLFHTKNSHLRFLTAFLHKSQFGLNLIFRILLKNKGAESRLFSPFLIYVGVKCS